MKINHICDKMITFLKKRYIGIPLLLFILFFLTLNLSTVFASTLFKVPVLGRVARVLCIQEYDTNDAHSSISVKQPAIEIADDKRLEEQINTEIDKRVDAMRKQLMQDSNELEEAYDRYDGMATAQLNSSIDYKVTCQEANLLSFQLIVTQQLNNAYQDFQTYNINLKTGKDITLEDLFGKSYRSIINEKIEKTIKEREKKDTNNLYFTGSMGFQGIDEKTLFYINEKNEVVIFFKKYEIAPGYMGVQKFAIPCKKVQSIIDGE